MAVPGDLRRFVESFANDSRPGNSLVDLRGVEPLTSPVRGEDEGIPAMAISCYYPRLPCSRTLFDTWSGGISRRSLDVRVGKSPHLVRMTESKARW
jgi:hypothetical protein